MPRTGPASVKALLRKAEALLEVAALTLAYYYVWKLNYRLPDTHAYYGRGKLLLAGVYAALLYLSMDRCDGFRFGYLKTADLAAVQWTAAAFVNIITYFQLSLAANRLLDASPMVLLMAGDFLLCPCFILLYDSAYRRVYAPKDMLMLYGREGARSLPGKMNRRPDKYRVAESMPAYGDFGRVREKMAGYEAVILNDIAADRRNEILKYCYGRKIRTYVVPKISDTVIRGAEEISLFDTPLLLVKGSGPTLAQLFVKRAMDIALCLLVLAPSAVLMPFIAAAIKLEDGGPVFFRQERVTKDGKLFRVLKFRSMAVDAEKDGEAVPAADNDPRITRVGKFLRAARLDELPQIMNILKGEMSVVGPRPERTEHHEKYGREIPEFWFRTKMKAGLTGYAQVYGKYNTSAYDKLRMDLEYIEGYSLLLDIKLVVMTVGVMFKKEATEGFDGTETGAEIRK